MLNRLRNRLPSPPLSRPRLHSLLLSLHLNRFRPRSLLPSPHLNPLLKRLLLMPPHLRLPMRLRLLPTTLRLLPTTLRLPIHSSHQSKMRFLRHQMLQHHRQMPSKTNLALHIKN